MYNKWRRLKYSISGLPFYQICLNYVRNIKFPITETLLNLYLSMLENFRIICQTDCRRVETLRGTFSSRPTQNLVLTSYDDLASVFYIYNGPFKGHKMFQKESKWLYINQEISLIPMPTFCLCTKPFYIISRHINTRVFFIKEAGIFILLFF